MDTSGIKKGIGNNDIWYIYDVMDASGLKRKWWWCAIYKWCYGCIMS